MSFALTGSLLAFFLFNVFGKENKIFLGDTGSLIIGLIIAVFTIRFLEYELSVKGKMYIESPPAMAFGILIVPLFDTLRMMLIRLSQGRSPFKADRQHIHHRLLELGNSHFRATLIILTVNIGFIALCLLLQSIGTVWLIILLLLLGTLLSYIPILLVNRKLQKV